MTGEQSIARSSPFRYICIIKRITVGRIASRQESEDEQAKSQDSGGAQEICPKSEIFGKAINIWNGNDKHTYCDYSGICFVPISFKYCTRSITITI